MYTLVNIERSYYPAQYILLHLKNKKFGVEYSSFINT